MADEIDLEEAQQRVADREAKHDAALAKMDALIVESETRKADRADLMRAQRDATNAALLASRAAHREALLRESVGRQELLSELHRTQAELQAMIAKYEPDRLPKDDTPIGGSPRAETKRA